jgi:3-oxoadipate enol-lactonase
MSNVNVKGTELYYEVHGAGPAIVFAHGAGGNHLSWWQQVPFFARNFTCVTFDHRGFGYSQNTPASSNHNAYAEDLLGLLDHLGIERTALVGQSMGGSTCLGFAVANPHRTSALVLADTTGRIADPGVIERQKARMAAGEVPADRLARVLSAGFRERQSEMTFLYAQIAALNLSRTDSLPAATTSEGVSIEELSRFNVPTHFIVGQEDLIFPPEIVRTVAQHVNGARVTEVRGAGHSVYFEKPKTFNRIVSTFLASVVG